MALRLTVAVIQSRVDRIHARTDSRTLCIIYNSVRILSQDFRSRLRRRICIVQVSVAGGPGVAPVNVGLMWLIRKCLQPELSIMM
jgi:hypothetical protein